MYLEAAERAVACGWPGVEPVVPQLLDWLKDCNWPVAHILAPFLAGIGCPLAPYLRPILDGEDTSWKYWILSEVIRRAPLSLVEQLRPELDRIARNPTVAEIGEGISDDARIALARLSDDA
jgi:Domain of unknown function (DUF5071)